MLRPIDKLSFVGVAALLPWTESEHGKLCESVRSIKVGSMNAEKNTKKKREKNRTRKLITWPATSNVNSEREKKL